MKTLLILTYGDANNLATWSNVPFLLVKSLKNKGIKVYTENIETKQNIFTYLYSFLFILINKKSYYYFVRSKINYDIVERKIKKIIKKYDDIVDGYLCLSYDYNLSKYTNKKVILLHDWSIEWYIKEIDHRDKLYLSEKKYINRVNDSIKAADNVITLVYTVFDYFVKIKKYQNIYYFGCPVNACYDIKGFNNTKNDRNIILFIGKKSYEDALNNLIEAYDNNWKYELHVIGLSRPNATNIIYHGYLNKSNEKELQEYYELLRKAIVVVNTKEKWGGMSSIIEAMYYYRPVIIYPTEEFKKLFGNYKKYFFSKNDHVHIKKSIDKIINMKDKDYNEICNNAHNLVKDYIYDNYVEKIIDLYKEKR